MKTLAILIFTALTTFSSFASGVKPLPTLVEGTTITVYFEDDKSDMLNVSITDRYGYELLSEKIQNKNRKFRKYNLEQLPFGEYSLKIESDQKIVYKTIKMERNNSVVLNEKVTFKPTTFFKNDRWLVNALALGEKVSIKIYDEKFQELFEDKFKNESVIAKSYNLSELAYGVYTLSVTIGDNSFNKVIAKM